MQGWYRVLKTIFFLTKWQNPAASSSKTFLFKPLWNLNSDIPLNVFCIFIFILHLQKLIFGRKNSDWQIRSSKPGAKEHQLPYSIAGSRWSLFSYLILAFAVGGRSENIFFSRRLPFYLYLQDIAFRACFKRFRGRLSNLLHMSSGWKVRYAPYPARVHLPQ